LPFFRDYRNGYRNFSVFSCVCLDDTRHKAEEKREMTSNTFKQKQKSALPGGISSDARRLPNLDGQPFVVTSSSGALLKTKDNREYIDYAMGFGVTVLGHAPERVIKDVKHALDHGPMPGLHHEGETTAAVALTARTGNLSLATFVNTGSEAVHLACRIARAVTGRPLVAKIAAGYDGWYNDIAVGLCGSSEADWRDKRPIFKEGVTLLRYNDIDDVIALFRERSDIAAVIVEPMLANAGCIEPEPTYLNALVETARNHGALVIADEVLTGFRLVAGLSSQVLGIDPDLATVGKAIGSGFAVAAVLGTPTAFAPIIRETLRRSGTYNGNPVATSAVIATMAELQKADYATLLKNGRRLREGIVKVFADCGMEISTSGFDNVFSLWPTVDAPKTYRQAVNMVDQAFALSLHLSLRRQGINIMPDAWGRMFVTFAHGDDLIDRSITAFSSAAAEIVHQKDSPNL
jgi:glutamate-1-semialdehyde 2,1-aminomutase